MKTSLYALYKKVNGQYFFLIKENNEYQLLVWDMIDDWRLIENLVIDLHIDTVNLRIDLELKNSELFNSLSITKWTKRAQLKIETVDCFGYTERNDCTVRCIANCCEVSYNEAYNLLKDHGRRSKKGFNISGFVFQKSGIVFSKRFIKITEGFIPKTLKQFLDNFQSGTFMIRVSGHVTCIKDGVCYDSGRKLRNKRIKEIYFIEQIENNN